MVVNQGPKDASCVCFDLWMVVWGAQECHQAWQKVIVLQEVDFVLAAVNRGISDEEEDLSNQLIDWRHGELSFYHACLRNCWYVHRV